MLKLTNDKSCTNCAFQLVGAAFSCKCADVKKVLNAPPPGELTHPHPISASSLYDCLQDVVKTLKYTLKGVKFPFTSQNNVVGELCNNMAQPQNVENNHSVLPFGGGQFC